MTDAALATHAVAANEIEMEARAALDGQAEERPSAEAVLRQAVALRKVLESWIVKRAVKAHREQQAAAAR